MTSTVTAANYERKEKSKNVAVLSVTGGRVPVICCDTVKPVEITSIVRM
jgi:hypothetical protein